MVFPTFGGYGLTPRGREEAENAAVSGDLEHDILASLLDGKKAMGALVSEFQDSHNRYDIETKVKELVRSGMITGR